MQTTEGKVDTCKALDASLVDIESSRTESKEQDTSSRSGNDAHADDVDIRPIYDEEPMDETIQKRLDDKKLQIQECTVQEVKALDAILEHKAQEHCMISF
nr:hypothetical protein [Tanacetum cinerariifolium]